jgi:hypothetical protein
MAANKRVETYSNANKYLVNKIFEKILIPPKSSGDCSGIAVELNLAKTSGSPPMAVYNF